MINLKGYNLKELESFVNEYGESRYRAIQLFRWLYNKGVLSFREMTDISKDFRSVLEQIATIRGVEPELHKQSVDGTVKFLFKLADNLSIESVLIPAFQKSTEEDSRLTLCVSTQVGCPLACQFCATGLMGFKRNLTAGEIVDQVLQAQRIIKKRITNIVYMGMGEPMLNYDNVLKSVELINDERGLNIGARHITISTAGYANKIMQLADDNVPVKLALSLHTLDNKKREQIMPITKKFSVSDLIDALAYYYRKTRRRPTFEYIVFEGFNNTEEDIRQLIKVGKQIPCKINLIPYHSINFVQSNGIKQGLVAASPESIERFAQQLRKENLTVMVRSSSGKDIQAACGQLIVLHHFNKEIL